MSLKSRVSVTGSAAAVAALALASGATGQTTTPAPAPTPTTPPTPATPTTPALPPGVIAPGVTIAGVPVGGQTAAQARATVTAAFAPRMANFVLVARGKRVTLSPRTSGYSADIPRAVKAALMVGRSKPNVATDIPVTQRVNATRLAAVIRYRTKSRDVPARDATTVVRNNRLVLTKSRAGVAIDVPGAVKRVRAQMLNRRTSTVPLPSRRVRANVTTPPDAILVVRSSFRLTVAHNGRLRAFPVAVGMPAYPTPYGNFQVTDMQRNPTWYPPDSRWAAGLGPVPPGSGNPLGTRWIGTSAPGIGMHGTPSPGSIGTRASHGCIRMYIGDAERLFTLTSVGTPVYIR